MRTGTKILRNEAIRGGTPVIAGTRITVTDVVRYYRMYLSKVAARFTSPPDPRRGWVVPLEAIVGEIRSHLRHLSPAQIEAALAYWHDHRVEVEQELKGEEAAALEAKQRYSGLP